ncbi:hypothetical protein UPYG_G00132880 [Umbra pygmaea]|uniref:Uncharacterized protein n=1 Tax=Umbra pygmaea TaxID=75934 RepID=A0ABD0WTT8_UMBPY
MFRNSLKMFLTGGKASRKNRNSSSGGSMSDREIFKLSGIANQLTPDIAIMVNNLALCNVYLACFSRNTQMSRGCHADSIHCMSKGPCGEVHQEGEREQTLTEKYHFLCVEKLFNVVNYQYGPLVKGWATRQ